MAAAMGGPAMMGVIGGLLPSLINMMNGAGQQGTNQLSGILGNNALLQQLAGQQLGVQNQSNALLDAFSQLQPVLGQTNLGGLGLPNASLPNGLPNLSNLPQVTSLPTNVNIPAMNQTNLGVLDTGVTGSVNPYANLFGALSTITAHSSLGSPQCPLSGQLPAAAPVDSEELKKTLADLEKKYTEGTDIAPVVDEPAKDDKEKVDKSPDDAILKVLGDLQKRLDKLESVYEIPVDANQTEEEDKA